MNPSTNLPITQGWAECDVLAAALRYHEFGWSIIPIQPGNKKSVGRWKSHQTIPPDEEQVREWFGTGSNYGIGIVCGEVSGDLVCRDFDDMESYKRWAAQHSDLAQTLPTVETGRPGRHVYFRADINEIRRTSKSGSATIPFDDGELRGSGYCLLPPSKHPNGTQYRWIIPPGVEIPRVDLISSGLLSCYIDTRENRGLRSEQKTFGEEGGESIPPLQQCPQTSLDSGGSLDTMFSLESMDSLLHDAVEQAIQRTLPTGNGQRHRLLFELAREIKAIPALSDAPVVRLKQFVKRWHREALPRIRTKPFEESWFDFSEAWDKVRHPMGEGPIDEVFAKAVKAELPKEAEQYEQPELRLLVALCRELQRASGTAPFFVDCRTAGRLVGVTYVRASRWLRGLCRDEVLRLVSQGSYNKRQANRYLYLGNL